MSKIKVGIINVTGYAGSELARILFSHPNAEIKSVTGRSAAGQKLADVFPHLADIDIKIEPDLVGDVDVVFSAMPHKASAEALIPLIKKGVKVIDISADFRLKNPQDYPDWYSFQHPAPELLEKAVFGLPELYREKIKKAQIVANPGCYPTSAILGMAPAIKAGIINPDIIIDSKSGISGAGRTLALNVHFAEATESVTAYALQGHRHLPEIVQELTFITPGFKPLITFLPHLIPMSRGILSSCYAGIQQGKLAGGADELKKIYNDFYKGEPFVRVVNTPPATKQASGSNFSLIYPAVDKRTNRVIIISCLDNLVKGAAGQAIQNMNIMFGFPETAGLESLPLYP
jgi:N-acetyl-gamma-glutamyl-phosphate reductase